MFANKHITFGLNLKHQTTHEHIYSQPAHMVFNTDFQTNLQSESGNHISFSRIITLCSTTLLWYISLPLSKMVMFTKTRIHVSAFSLDRTIHPYSASVVYISRFLQSSAFFHTRILQDGRFHQQSAHSHCFHRQSARNKEKTTKLMVRKAPHPWLTRFWYQNPPSQNNERNRTVRKPGFG